MTTTLDFVKQQHKNDYTAILALADASLDECRKRKHNLQKKLHKLRKHLEGRNWNDDCDLRFMIINCHIEAITEYMKRKTK